MRWIYRWKGHALLWEYIQLRVWGTEGSCMVADGLERERNWKTTGKDGIKKREFFSWRICLVRDEYDVSHIVNDAPWWFWIVVLLLRGVVGYEKSKMPKYAIEIHVFSMVFGSREKLDVSRMTRPSQTYSFAWDLGGWHLGKEKCWAAERIEEFQPSLQSLPWKPLTRI